MKHLGERLYTLIKHGVKLCGTFNPEEIFCFFEEDLYADEVKPVRDFLQWVHDGNGERDFGSGNYEERFSQF